MDHLSGIECADQKIHRLRTLKKGTAMKLKRRSVLKGMLASSVGISALKIPALAEPASFKIGLLTVKTGPPTEGGVQMEQGIMALLKDRNYSMAGRKVKFISADTGGIPAGALTKVKELIELDHVDFILRPLAHLSSWNQRLCRRAQDADDEPRGGRQHQAAQGQLLFRSRFGDTPLLGPSNDAYSPCSQPRAPTARRKSS
jgi:Periplasmic binding protein